MGVMEASTRGGVGSGRLADLDGSIGQYLRVSGYTH
jgi:hypothetical protein